MTNSGSGNGFHLGTLAIIGVGLIGGSLSLGLKKRRLVGHVVGFGRNRDNLDRALDVGAIDAIAASPCDAAASADMVVLATPVGAMGDIFQAIAPVLPEKSVVTDVGSVKQGVAAAARGALGPRLGRFVPGHPVAGKEHSGVSAASADLYVDHRVALTPMAESEADAVDQVAGMWRSVGAEIVLMEVAEHDRVLAMTSHLPHLLAYAMVNYFAADPDREKCYEMVAGGFYDFTRIASSDPVMWRDICGMNQATILQRIRGYREKLEILEDLVAEGNDLELEALFSAAREARQVVTERRRIAPSNEQVTGRRRVRQLVNR